MYIVSLLLFLVGIAAFGLAFSFPGWEMLIFAGGIILVSLAMAIPMHARSNARMRS